MSSGIASGVKTSAGAATSSTSISSPSRSLYEALAVLPFTSTSSFSMRRCKRARLQPPICEARYASSRSPACDSLTTDNTDLKSGFKSVLSVVNCLPIAAFEVFHERHERFDTGARKRVVDRCANAADGSMPLQAVEALCRRFRRKLFLELFRRQAERDIHRRPAVDISMTAIKTGRVDSM